MTFRFTSSFIGHFILAKVQTLSLLTRMHLVVTLASCAEMKGNLGKGFACCCCAQFDRQQELCKIAQNISFRTIIVKSMTY